MIDIIDADNALEMLERARIALRMRGRDDLIAQLIPLIEQVEEEDAEADLSERDPRDWYLEN